MSEDTLPWAPTADQIAYLDALVFDVAAGLVHNITKTGEQINYLLANGWTLDEIKEWVS